MDLINGSTYWDKINSNLKGYPSLNKNIDCDVVIVGGGITGCLMLYYLTEYSVDAVLIEENTVCSGSTCASTCLLQYEIDTDLIKLIDIVGKDKAVRSYKLCQKAIDDIERIIININGICNFEKKDSLYLCSNKMDEENLRDEYQTRKKYGFDVELLERVDIERLYPFTSECGIYSKIGGQIDPVNFCNILLKHCFKKGAKIYENTKAQSFDFYSNDVKINLSTDSYVKCKNLIFCTGYNSNSMMGKKNLVTLNSTYSIATNKINDFSSWYNRSLIWETARPYTYIRTTSDNRIIAGGFDDNFINLERREANLKFKSKYLINKLKSLFPEMDDIKADYAWAGVFGETKDGLPYIGKHPTYPNTYLNLGFGGNGVTFSVIGAQIIKDLILYNNNPDANIFSLNRKY
ncbi:NAD(P)/FAD-dependent oxidoreductase [Clostridium sp. DL1XJH146]